MRFNAFIEVRLKPGYSDPEGETTRASLRDLNYDVERVDVSKVYRVTFNAENVKEAERTVEEMCIRLLANPTKDDYRYEISVAT